jgi:hypothetical protein
MLRIIKDVLGLEHMGLTDDNALPMTAVFDRQQNPLDYTAIVPEGLRTTELPLPPKTACHSRLKRSVMQRQATMRDIGPTSCEGRILHLKTSWISSDSTRRCGRV